MIDDVSMAQSIWADADGVCYSSSSPLGASAVLVNSHTDGPLSIFFAHHWTRVTWMGPFAASVAGTGCAAVWVTDSGYKNWCVYILVCDREDLLRLRGGARCTFAVSNVTKIDQNRGIWKNSLSPYIGTFITAIRIHATS